MPTDTGTQTLEVDASLDQVLAVIRDVASQPVWVNEVKDAEVLEKYDDGTPAVAKLRASSPVGDDVYTLSYTHRPDGMSWSLVEGRLQTGQDGNYALRKLARGRTEVTFTLTISHHLPLPGFVRRKVINGLVSSTITGLKAHVEAG
jgi:hypothetical protein